MLPAQQAVALIQRDPLNPGRESGGILQLAEIVPCFQKGRLQNVLGVSIRPDCGFHQRKHLLIVQMVQRCEAVAVAGLRGKDQRLRLPLQIGFRICPAFCRLDLALHGRRFDLYPVGLFGGLPLFCGRRRFTAFPAESGLRLQRRPAKFAMPLDRLRADRCSAAIAKLFACL